MDNICIYNIGCRYMFINVVTTQYTVDPAVLIETSRSETIETNRQIN